jgi:hypothetical protein
LEGIGLQNRLFGLFSVIFAVIREFVPADRFAETASATNKIKTLRLNAFRPGNRKGTKPTKMAEKMMAPK